MSDITPINVPAGFAPAFALGFDDGSGSLSLASHAAPVPVAAIGPVAVNAARPETPPALVGSTSVSLTAGPFVPTPDVPVLLQIEGDWEGRLQVLRSHDGGLTQVPLTAGGQPWGSYRSNICEPVWAESEDGIELYFEIALASGTLDYRVSQ
jgi:hypothetical protein